MDKPGKDAMLRIPMAQRFASLETVSDDSLVTSTMLHSSLLNQEFSAQPVLTVTQAGELQAADVVAATELFQVRWEDAHPFNLEEANNHHLLLLDGDVDPRELEALAVSIWANAHWAGNRKLHLFTGASLHGPFKISTAAADSLGIPAHFVQIWVVEVTPERIPAEIAFPGGVDPWASCFSQERPAGAELGCLNALLRISKRLAGAVRIASTANPGNPQVPVQSDPESAVNLRVYASRWLRESTIRELLDEQNLEPAGCIQLDNLESLTAEEIPREEKTDFTSFSVIIPAGNRSQIQISVRVVADHLPMAVRHQPWPLGQAVEYDISWLMENAVTYSSFQIPPAGAGLASGLGLSRTLRLERKRVSAQIEQIALMLAKSCAGVILDEGGFLIAD